MGWASPKDLCKKAEVLPRQVGTRYRLVAGLEKEEDVYVDGRCGGARLASLPSPKESLPRRKRQRVEPSIRRRERALFAQKLCEPSVEYQQHNSWKDLQKA